MFERFTDRARRVLVLAQEEARLLNHAFIGTEHLLLGLIQEGEGIAAQALSDLDITVTAVRTRVEEVIGLSGGAASDESRPFTPRAKKVLELSLREALQLGHNYIGTEHLLLGLVQEGEGVAAQVLVSLGADLARVRQEVIQLVSGHLSGEPVGPGAVGTPHGGATVVVCSFCGRGSPESGRLVSGDDAFICEHCIRDWHGRLGQVHTGVARGYTVTRHEDLPAAGTAPDDAGRAEADIRAAFAGSGTGSEDGASVPTVEEGETLGPVLAAAKERHRGLAPSDAGVVIAVETVVFVDPAHAAVRYTVSVDGTTMLTRRGDAVQVDGAWKVARSTFCDLMALAGVPCPPDTE
jgi:Clp amino terminal domain, pathogenicity island component/ClpX C4-type zinc finger